jgi:hypothetical protein
MNTAVWKVIKVLGSVHGKGEGAATSNATDEN